MQRPSHSDKNVLDLALEPPFIWSGAYGARRSHRRARQRRRRRHSFSLAAEIGVGSLGALRTRRRARLASCLPRIGSAQDGSDLRDGLIKTTQGGQERGLFLSPQKAAGTCRCRGRLKKACLTCLMCLRLSNDQLRIRPVVGRAEPEHRSRPMARDYFDFQMKPK